MGCQHLRIIFCDSPVLAPVSTVSTYPLNSVALLLGDGNSLCTRRQGRVVVGILAQKLEELVGVRGNQLGQLRVAGTELLQDGLEHLRLLLHHLAQLLELGVVAEEVEVAQVAGTTAGSGGSGSGSSS